MRKSFSLFNTLPPIYRVFALAIGISHLFPSPYTFLYDNLSPWLFAGVVSAYTVIKVFLHFRFPRFDNSTTLLVLDVCFCTLLIFTTGGVYSPFLLYTVSPVITSALLLQPRLTVSIATISILYVTLSHITISYIPTYPTMLDTSYFMVYAIAITLAACLPYLANVNLRQKIQAESILRERQRLSRELHDGITQTLAVLHWQSQLIQRQLQKSGLQIQTIKQMESLINDAQKDAREALHLLHSNGNSGSFLPQLQTILDNMSNTGSIISNMRILSTHFHLNTVTEVELIRICQEVLVNVRKHSKARHVKVAVQEIDNNLEVTIIDDGRGFDYSAYLAREDVEKGYGLAVIQERAESVGGKVSVSSTPGQGTTVLICVPCIEHSAGVIWQSAKK
ncbi:MAG: sensor histidine kinase [Dehalococcoidales bacterium]|nr:sensor histidine kinase [Dehalococcoidales bacterium]MDX9802457.1 sensor histidine kinase [Dehalococcoidales bacterium]